MVTKPENIDVAQVREAVQQQMAASGKTQGQVAKESAVGASTLSQFLKGDYQGRLDTVANKMVAWLNLQQAGADRVALPVAPRWIETRTAQRVWSALAYAQLNADMAVIYGGAGYGKSVTAREYARTNPNVWLVTAKPETSSVATMLESIAYAMDLRDFPLHPARLSRTICQQIARTGGLLIMDEAQHLQKPALESLRSIHDETGIGLVLCGNASVYNRMYGKGVEAGFDQLFSRIGRRLVVSQALAGDVEAIAAVYRVQDRAAMVRLREIGGKPGALRMVVKVCRLAAVLAGGQPIGRAEIEAGWEELQSEPLTGDLRGAA